MKIINVLREKLKEKILAERTQGRFIKVRESDVFLVSYPKSGNTWFRFLVGNLISDDEVTFLNMERIVPAIYGNTDRYLSTLANPRFLKSHEYYDPRYKKILFLVRDPRSIAVSYFHHSKKFRLIDSKMNFENYINLFISGKIDSYGSWKENVGSWIGALADNRQKFLLIKYENLIEDTYSELIKVAEFLKIDVNDEIIAKTIKLSSFDRMKNLEQVQKSKIEIFRNTDLKMPFIRKGKTNEWRRYFNNETISKLNSAYGDLMLKLGYEVDY